VAFIEAVSPGLAKAQLVQVVCSSSVMGGLAYIQDHLQEPE